MSASTVPPPVTPRAASTTLVVRDGDGGLEVLMLRRSLQASFMPGAYVFPGGAVDASDADTACATLCDEPAASIADRIGAVTEVGEHALGHAVAALRECFEECGLWLGAAQAPDAAVLARMRRRLHAGEAFAVLAAEIGLPLATRALQPWSHWVTPVGMPKRFDTLFFVAAAPHGQVPEVDAGETTTLAWVRPGPALAAHAAGAFPMEFATRTTVRSLLRFEARGAAALLAHAAAQRHLPPLHPRLARDAEGRIAGVLLPGEAGYDQAA
ncbi:NUDIX hydrolase [Piscinibacter koreensis]|uniref:NUDIX hydrolase n=1 Tax=Piscinibacter koreensis TaxID=2742824 RepID=A0A7Y6TWK2_9BURK|nr:NUDIX hydrolase [Schlegelella koreensis]NUZ06122.1 NUDIX hydrolase [Schlegelella koreensis]